MKIKNNFENIGLFFDKDFINLIYTDLEINKNLNLEINLKIENNVEVKKIRENKNEIKIFNLKNYKVGSIGYTSRELEKERVDFSEIKVITNDYNGTSPSYDIVCAKIIFNKKSEKILGFQIANSKNIEDRLNCVKKMIEEDKELKDLGVYKLYPSKDETEIDVISMAAIIGSRENKNTDTIKQINADELSKVLKQDSYILDVREDEEYQVGHVKGAINISLRTLVAELKNLPKDKNIYVYCRTAHRSLDATMFLTSIGFENVYNVRGGIIELSFNEFYKDKGDLKNSILTNYTFK